MLEVAARDARLRHPKPRDAPPDRWVNSNLGVPVDLKNQQGATRVDKAVRIKVMK
jgi:hypothetical protein